MTTEYLHPGMEMLCDMAMRKAWLLDGKALLKEQYNNPFFDPEHDEETLSQAADAVIICGKAAEDAEELGNEDLSNILYDIACEALKAYLAILWDLALPQDMGGSEDIDHPPIRGEIGTHQLGLDTRTKRQWLDTRLVDANGSKLMATCADWWRFMWEEIEDMKERG